jgi:hypothetical protein
MIGLVEQLCGLALLVCGIWIGWHRWIRPYHRELNFQALGMLMLAVLTVMGGLIGSPFWWMDDPNSFSWTLPPLAGRLLGAAGFAFAVTGCYVLEQRQQRLIRSYIAMLAVYLAPLVAVILLFHLNRFNWGAAITYAFFAVAGGMAAAALWHLFRGTTLGAEFQGPTERSVPWFVQAWLWLVAIVTGLWGLAMFLYPQGPLPQIWVWPQDPLTSRLIATMLLTLCAGALLALHSAAQARMGLWMFTAYGTGAAAACFWNAVAGNSVPVSYAGAFGSLALGSILCVLYLRRESILVGQ